MTLNTPSSVRLGVRPMISRTLAYSSALRPNSAASAWETVGDGLAELVMSWLFCKRPV